jgi:hypothetical protein
VTYRKDDGEIVEQSVGWTVQPDQNGGRLDLVFLPDGKIDVSSEMFRDPVLEKGVQDREVNLAEARKRYEALEPGMQAEKAARVLGMETRPDRKYGWSKDFGWSLEPGCVEVSASILDGKVARVVMSYPYDDLADRIIEQKGMSAEEYQRN